MQLGLKLDQLAPGHERVERSLLKGDADAAAYRVGLGGNVVAGHAGVSAGGAQERDQHAHDGGLAGSVWPEEAIHLTRLDREIDAIDGLDGPLELTLQVDRFDREHRGAEHTRGVMGARAAGNAPVHRTLRRLLVFN